MSKKDEMKITPARLIAARDVDMKNFIAAATPGGIEAQEAQGQEDFVESQTLPIDCPKEQLEMLGFVFQDPADDIFVNVVFPEGWSVVPTEHSMWSDLVDPKQNKRGGIFYKAAFYDRSAQLHLNRAVTLTRNYELKEALQFLVMHGEEVLFPTDIVRGLEQYSDEYWVEEKRLKKVAEDWMSKNYPNSDNVMLYWE